MRDRVVGLMTTITLAAARGIGPVSAARRRPPPGRYLRPVTTTVDETQTSDTTEQAAFRAKVRAFLSEHSQPKREASPWALNFHTDAEDARRGFEAGRAWQRTRYGAGMAGFTYPKEVGGQGGEAWQERIYDEEAVNYEGS